MEWVKVIEENMPKGDIQCIVIMKGGYIDALSWCAHYGSWDDFSGDDHFCDMDKVSFFMPFDSLPPVPNMEEDNV